MLKPKTIIILSITAVVFLVLLIFLVFYPELLRNIFSRTKTNIDDKNQITEDVIPKESCYINLKIKETKTEAGIQFSLLETTNLFGLYGGLVNNYNPELESDYVLKVYDTLNNLIGSYSLYSGRLIFYDNLDNSEKSGGAIELESGIIASIIPYDAKITKITVDDSGKETILNVNTLDLKCERTCKIENETGNYTTNVCCIGLTPATQKDGSFVCTKCGDDICSQYEDGYSCYEDCL
jgi:hypothetical protein